MKGFGCLFYSFIDDYETANELFEKANLQTVNHDLSEVVDSEGQVYSIEKYCYSNPSNLMVGHIEEETSVVAASRMTYHFRLQTVGGLDR